MSSTDYESTQAEQIPTINPEVSWPHTSQIQQSAEWGFTKGEKEALVTLTSNVADLVLEVSKLRELTQNFGFQTELHSLNSTFFKIVSPISIIVTKEDDIYYAEPIEFDIYGEGGDEKAAIENLKENLVFYYDNLISSRQTLSDLLKVKLSLLKKFISKV